MRFALLFAEDRVFGNRYFSPFYVLGDGASALLLEKGINHSILVDTIYFSIGRFHKILGIYHGRKSNFDTGEFENKIVPLHYRVITDLICKIVKRNNLHFAEIDLVLYQNMSKNDYLGLMHVLQIDESKIYLNGLKSHGHIFGSDIVINYSLARSEGRISPDSNILFVSSGAGFSWATSLVRA